jgi:hypothetical protein
VDLLGVSSVSLIGVDFLRPKFSPSAIVSGKRCPAITGRIVLLGVKAKQCCYQIAFFLV